MDLLEEKLEFAKETAREAGKLVRKMLEEEVKIERKADKSEVTTIDYKIDQYTIERTGKEFPQDGILTEESRDNKKRLKKRDVWTYDPIDGTHNLCLWLESKNVHLTSRYFAVHVGLSRKGVAVVGAVYLPMFNALFYAAEGLGAYKQINGSPPVSLKINPTPSIPVDREYVVPEEETFKKAFQITPRNKRRFGKVLGCYLIAVAENALDAHALYLRAPARFAEWDTCAPEIIVREAGGIVTDFYGEPLKYNKPEPFFYNGIITQKKKGMVPFISNDEKSS